MSRKITLKVGKDWKSSPLVDEDGDYVHPSNLEDLSDDLITALWTWQHDFDESSAYYSWSMYSKISFEKSGLTLAQCLSKALPRGMLFSYYSELYQQEIDL